MTAYAGAKPVTAPFFVDKGVCNICNRRRGEGNHARCAKIRQAKFAAENGARNG